MTTRTPFKFRLYMAGNAPNSIEALGNLRSLCEQHLSKRYEIELIDVFRHGNRALADGIFMTPTLVKLSPQPAQKIIGSLSDTRGVLRTLGLAVPVV